MRYHPFPGRKPLSTGETALRRKGGLAWISVLLALCLVAGMVPVFSSGVKVSARVSDTVLAQHTVDTITDMEGVTVNLFDYWITKENEGNNPSRTSDTGINEDKTLRFGSGGDNGYFGNIWDQNDGPYYDQDGDLHLSGKLTGDVRQGIVQNQLGEDGYPLLTPQLGFQSQSLEYLFNPNSTDSVTSSRKTFENVTGLFQIDENGYYYYDAKKNYASFNENTNSFTVYDTWGVKPGSGSADKTNGQFFPFEDANNVFDYSWQDGFTQADIYASTDESGGSKVDSALNHYFGFTLETDFLQPTDGNITVGETPQAMTFEFSGDDDVWVFIDGVLVMDMGGLHNSATGTINFATGEVEVIGYTAYNNEGEATEEGARYHKTTIKDCFTAAGVEATFDGNTFADNTYHTLTFFYLERGGNASNMALKFNLETLPVNQVVKMDENGESISGAKFELYDADYQYAYNEEEDKLLDVTTGQDGTIEFLDTDGKPYDFTQSYNGATDLNGNTVSDTSAVDSYQFYVLKETEVPDGYRSVGDIQLRYNCRTGQLLVTNKWDTGALANFTVVVSQEGQPTIATVPTDNDFNVGNLLPNDDIANGTMFAVVLMRTEEGSSPESIADDVWVPLYGSNSDGWSISGDTNLTADMDDILAAARQNPYIFSLNNKMEYAVSIDELPGDITEYYYANLADEENCKYVISYYYTTASNLTNATSANTYRLNISDFERDFSSNLWIPNIRNQFEVEKVDANGNLITTGSATFELYGSDYYSKDGTVNTNAESLYTETTVNGVAVFGDDADELLITGQTYYLVETAPPAGYTASTDVVEIVVASTGVHANAGVEGDDVTVKVGIGTLVKPMEKFGTNDDIDATLHDVFGALQTGTESEGSINWGAVPGESPDTETIHLTYKDDAASAGIELMSYEPTFDQDNYEEGYFTYESGYGRMYVRQCTDDHGGVTVGSDNKTDLGDQNLTNLFTGSTVVQIKNAPVTGTVTVRKTVTGLQNPGTDEFEFTIAFIGLTGSSVQVQGSGRIADYDLSENIEVSVGQNNTITFYLNNGESLTFSGLPQGVEYTIIETTTGYTYSYATTVTDTDTEAEPQGTTFTNTVAEGDQILVTYTNAADVNFSFTKVDGDSGNANTPLNGAGFTLYRWVGTGDVSEDLINTASPDANWSVVSVTNTGSQFDFTGLYPDATYRLVETTTPGGYIAPEGQWQLTYDVQDDDWSISLVTASGTSEKTPAFKVVNSTLYLPNYTVPSIPVTGGEGGDWIIYGLAGTLLVGGAVLTLFGLLRKRRQG